MECNVVLKDIISFCSLCKHNDTECCDKCLNSTNFDSTTNFPTNFQIDKDKIPESIVYDYYDLLNHYSKLLNSLGFTVNREIYENN